MPRFLLLTDRRSARRPVEDVVRAAIDGGARHVLLRERDLPRPRRLALAGRLRALLAAAGGRLIVAGPDPLDGDAIHLPAAGPYPPPRLGLVGRSCHGTAELGRLTTEDFATLSPVFPTAAKPGYGPPLGTAGLRTLVAAAPGPVLALGGITTADEVAACRAAGAAGVAVMGAVMRAADPAGLVAALVSAAGVPAAGVTKSVVRRTAPATAVARDREDA
ncbi:thiamine phosphate synthase [Rhizomonospora bruguierae]|uniref:thiamine phosphate synthase n=1 Tax=Rhizomonospora bruguierae TaxID=1581705 RepID=UPI001BCA9F05|nr:thiamine phosphate synthase [Micromonospora sp. NBRC 107566]